MSAVSAESPRGSADLIPSSASTPGGQAPANGSSRADFGPNQWLVDELYQRYQADPGSVDRAWWSFFADYEPAPDSATQQSSASGPVQQSAVQPGAVTATPPGTPRAVQPDAGTTAPPAAPTAPADGARTAAP